MAKIKIMARKQNHDDDDASSRKRFKTCENSGVAPSSDLNHDVLFLIMKQLGFIDIFAFGGVCKSWRSFALSNRQTFMASRPPMLMRFSSHAYKKERYCHLEDFKGRRFKTLVPHSGGRRIYLGLTCGYLILFGSKTSDFWLVNPITRHELYFPAFPCFPDVGQTSAILVFSPPIRGWVFVVIDRCHHKIWFSIAGTGAWNHVYSEDYIFDIHAFKGKIYTLNFDGSLYEVRLDPEPKLTKLKINNIGERHIYYLEFVSSGENLFVSDNNQYPRILYEIDFGEMKWVSRDVGEFAFFFSGRKHGVAIKTKSWTVDPRSNYKSYDCFRDTNDETRKGRFFYANMWYFPHSCLDFGC